MPTYHVVFTAPVPDRILAKAEAEDARRARSWILSQSWYDRRRIDWTAKRTVVPESGQSPVRHEAVLELNCENSPSPATGSLALQVAISARQNDDPLEKARRVLDLPRTGRPKRRVLNPDSLWDRGSFSTIRSSGVIGPMPPKWPEGRMLTGYSSHLGSYGQGGVGLSGWQCNRGSWIVLPLTGSDGWIWLTREQIEPAQDFRSLKAVIDQRILGVHPDQLADFTPWEHRYAGHDQILDMPDFGNEKATIERFDANEAGFVLEAANGLTRWRFAMGDDLPRPIWAGSREPRLLAEGESLAEAFLLAHDCYLDV
ncbi:hypothetical protein NOLU111490_12930 [Novosphingobium lubricantis]|uniref:Uncharacterized protein n=2 Tax=Sphingomonadaceae TaxID=41297 RepID=G6EJW9_9SPHN|nr:hypothetical protein [Novosphingobium pentaromativorans]AIT82545.1 hypothetical protein JI59_24055 [Novosphingobium pentaromativorans US6-1]EHJ58407.1 hypothetical protein NSU_4640 [Novosphingobium pentaromativorans US6-1]KKC26859.1 hypothetical protein WP12_06555 [Sphingomonas sp. SRS2]OYX46765.1 MAG: hypothetical protein B7Y97_13255 [Sphingomonas sp. 32-66-10]